MMRALKSLLGGGKSAASGQGSPSLAPEHPLAVVGDIHGCPHLLEDALGRIEAHRNRLETPEALKIIMLGDYVDRGEDGASVLARLYQMQADNPDNVICLMGNHERMMLDFLDDPGGAGPRWMRNGGLQTLASYRIGGLRETSDAAALRAARDALVKAMPAGMIDWLSDLPLMYQSGNICCVHAAMDPGVAPAAQSEDVLLWGHPDFLRKARADGVWAAHGHTIVEQPMCQDSRIALDTGAYATGQLSVGLVTRGQIAFL